jgi:hypothetical protein
MEKKEPKSRKNPLSKDPHKRRSESEMLKIVTEINSGRIGKRAACIKYGLNRNTLALFIRKFSVRTLGEPLGSQLYHDMTEKQQIQLLEKKVRDLTKDLQHATLKSTSLETLIKAAEQELHIRIKKKPGTKQSKE